MKTQNDRREKKTPLMLFALDVANKAQVNLYATGLHEVGSSAVEHYPMPEIRDLFMLLCAAFNQPRYRIDKQQNALTDAESSVS